VSLYEIEPLAISALNEHESITNLVPADRISFARAAQSAEKPYIVLNISTTDYYATFDDEIASGNYRINYLVYAQTARKALQIHQAVIDRMKDYDNNLYDVRIADEAYFVDTDYVHKSTVSTVWRSNLGACGYTDIRERELMNAARTAYQFQPPWNGNDPNYEGSVYWHLANGTYDYEPPRRIERVAIKSIKYSSNALNQKLQTLNAFDNYWRFTNDRGEQYTESFLVSSDNTSSNPRYCIDHLTGIGIYVQRANELFNESALGTWQEAIDHAKNFSYATYDDWRVASMAEFTALWDYNDLSDAWGGVYSPWTDPAIRNYGGRFWLGDYTKDNTYNYFVTNSATFASTASTTFTCHHYLCVRNHYV